VGLLVVELQVVELQVVELQVVELQVVELQVEDAVRSRDRSWRRGAITRSWGGRAAPTSRCSGSRKRSRSFRSSDSPEP
jgi:hypothetical protein